MLTIALCIIALFIGIFLMAWFVLRIIDQVAFKIGDSLSTFLKGCFPKSPAPQFQYERTQKPDIDPGMIIKIMRFTFDFAINTIEEFYKKFDDFEADLWNKKDADNAVLYNQDEDLHNSAKKEFDSSGDNIFPSKESGTQQETKTERELWQEYLKKQSLQWTNTEGIPEEYPRNTEGIP